MEADTRCDAMETSRDETRVAARKRMHAKRPWRRGRKGAWVMAERLGVIGGCCEVGATGQEGERNEHVTSALARSAPAAAEGPTVAFGATHQESTGACGLALLNAHATPTQRDRHAALPIACTAPSASSPARTTTLVHCRPPAMSTSFGSSAISTLLFLRQQ